MPEIPFAGQLLEKDFREIQALAMRKMYWTIVVLFFVLVVINFATEPGELPRDPYGVFVTWLPVVIFIPLVAVVQRFAFRRHWRNDKIIQRPVHGVVSDQGIVWNVDDISTAKLPWQLLLRYRESANLVIVYQSLSQLLFFPRKYFASSEQWEAFRQIVSNNLQKK